LSFGLHYSGWIMSRVWLQGLLFRGRAHQRSTWLVAALGVGMLGWPLAGLGGSDPNPQAPPMGLDRTQRQTQDGVSVTIAIPTEDEAARHFGVKLAEHGVQPIWLRIENTSAVDYWLLPIAIDPDYYSPDEAALVTAAKESKAARAEATGLFRANALPFFLKAGGSNEGYVYASHMRGGRFVDVRLSGHLKSIRLRFAVLLPTEGFDYERSALRELYAGVNELPDLALDEFRQALRELPCCTTTADGKGEGDPLNVVLVGTGQDTIAALTAGGWSFTEAITVDSVRRMVGAAIAEKALLTAPVSSLYAFGRKQDVALQRGRSTISQRNHMRLWLAPFRCEGRPVWVGQVSRDIGVKATRKSPTLTTHVIDPIVDESREYLLHSLLHRDAVGRFAFVRGVGEAGPDRPRENLTGDSYITDGHRLVVWLSRDPLPPDLAENLGWNESADPVLEGKGEYSKVPALRDP
jgi:hypothetical protein